MKYKGFLILFGGLLVGISLGAVVYFGEPAQPADAQRRLPPTIGAAVSDFELAVLNGQTQRLGELKGRPVLINFWASWCGPCKEEMPILNVLAQKYPEDLVVLGINYAEPVEVVAEFAAAEGIIFPILLDQDGQVAGLYFVRNYPTTFFIDAEGTLQAQHIGLLSESLLARYLALIGIE